MLFPPPEDFGYRIFLVGAAVINLLLSLFSEMVLSDTLVRKAVNRKDKAYELVNKELRLQPKWPPLSPPSDGAAESNFEQSRSEDSKVLTAGRSVKSVCGPLGSRYQWNTSDNTFPWGTRMKRSHNQTWSLQCPWSNIQRRCLQFAGSQNRAVGAKRENGAAVAMWRVCGLGWPRSQDKNVMLASRPFLAIRIVSIRGYKREPKPY